MKDYKPLDTFIFKAYKFNLNKYSKNKFERKEIQNVLYISTIESMMYAYALISISRSSVNKR